MTSDSPDISAYKDAQAKLLDRFGLAAQSRFLALKDPRTRIHVLDAGSGDPILFIHGGAGVGAEIMPLAARFASHRIIIPDRPGHGLSDAFDVRRVNLRRMNVAFVTGLLDALGVERADLVSSSFGTFMALSFAIAHPDRVGRIAVVGSFPGFGTSIHPMLRLMGTPIVSSILQAVTPPSLEGTRAFFGTLLVKHIDRMPAELVELETLNGKLHGRCIARLFRAGISPLGWRSRYDLAPEMISVRVPTLLAWGDADAMWPITHAERVAKAMPNARLTVIRDAGHMPWIDQLDETSEIVRAFLVPAESV
jgi:pimeloyl-ACP methyl ester carboxylesterase